MEGSTVSHFRILERIGGGGMGVVYKAEDIRLERTVALKFLHPEMTENEARRKRFLREAKAVSALDHPNICTIYEIDETEDGQVFMAMACYSGRTLRDLARERPLAVGETLDLAIQLAAALGAAHDRGIVHRDVKPSNIQVTHDGVLKLLDFGLAKLAGQSRVTRSGTVLGTVAYMSPEQLESREVDARSDLWSLGVVLYELLAGELPFEGESEPAMMLSIVSRTEIPDVTSVRPDVPDELAAVLRRLLARDPDERFGSAKELERALELVRRDLSSGLTETMRYPLSPVSGSGRATPRASGLAVPKGPLRIAMIGGGLAAIVVAGILAWIALEEPEGLRGEAPSTLAVMPFSNLTGETERDYLAEGMSAVLVAQLARLPGVRVASSTESFAYRGRDLSLSTRELARELGVEAILEGQYFEQDDTSRIQLSLVSGHDGLVVWSRTVEAPRERLTELQNALARRVAEELVASLDEIGSTAAVTETSERAFDVYLRAKAQLERQGEPGAARRASSLFRRVLTEDPDFAPALAGLARSLVLEYDAEARDELLEGAVEAARTALEIDPDLAEGKVALATALLRRGQAAEAVSILDELVALEPELAEAHSVLAHAYDRAGRPDRAEASIRRAISLRPEYWRYWNELGVLLLRHGAHEAADEAFERAAGLTDVDVSWPLQNLAASATQRGDSEAAVEVYDRLPRPIEDAELASNMGTAYYYVGRLEDAEASYRLAVRLAPRISTFRANLADCLLRLGKEEAARKSYAAAAELQAAKVEADPSPESRLLLALYRAKGAQCEEAVAAGRALETSLGETWGNAYRLAKIYAVCGEREAALRSLEQAVELGLTPERLAADDEFRGLAGDPRFEDLLKS